MDKENSSADLLFLLKAAVVWMGAALILLLLCSAIISGFNLSSSSVAYFSSAISFVSAFAASYAVTRGTQVKRLKYGITTGLVLTVFLIMLGFIARGRELSADGVLSVLSFTLSGALVGCIFTPRTKRSRVRSVIKGKHRK